MIGVRPGTLPQHYCNWLSEQEGLPRGPVVLPPQRGRGYADGMTIPADVLRAHRLSPAHRGGVGIRLPLGYGDQPLLSVSRSSLLGKYAWYQANSTDHAWPCGSLLPNDLGLFDMLGNVSEWVHAKTVYVKDKRERIIDFIYRPESVNDKTPRPMRGGSLSSLPPYVRTAVRYMIAPMGRESDRGLRPSRTYP